MIEAEYIYLAKAEQSLAGAESEYANGRFENCATRCYYACFQGAVYALREGGVRATGSRSTWSHEGLQAAFVRQLINRQKRYPAELRDVLPRTMALRHTADYSPDRVSEVQAGRALRRSRLFVTAIQQGGAKE